MGQRRALAARRHVSGHEQRTSARSVALRALQRIEGEGAYANLALRAELDRSELDDRDRRFVTELVYGTTRMRRACDFLVDRFLLRPVDDEIRSVLRLGAYQVHFAGVPAHAAVSETVALAPRQARGLVNAVLRRVVDDAGRVARRRDPAQLSRLDRRAHDGGPRRGGSDAPRSRP